jgi:carboxylate-amine ligase
MAAPAGPAAFDRQGTLGVEEEFYIVDEAGRPVAGTDTLVYESTPPAILEDRLDHELFKCVIETQTPTCESLQAATRTLREVRTALIEHASDHGYLIAGAGLHPAARWRTLEHAEKARYRAQLDRIQYPQHRNTTAGLHVHVGVDDADKAVWVANECRWHLPLLLAVAANSPYWNGFDTGLASARAKIFEGLPNTGMPTAFDSYAAFERFEERMLATNSIRDRGELWFDVRPHSALGTVEVRAPDGQSDPDRVAWLVEWIEALVTDLSERYEDGATGRGARREVLDENKWRALRYGREASFLTGEADELITVPEAVERTADRLGTSAPRKLLEAECGAERQRRLVEERGAEALYADLLLESPS